MKLAWPLDEQGRSIVLTVLCGAGLVLALATGSVWFTYAAIAFGSVHAVRAAWETLREKQLDVNTLMLLAAVGSIAVGLPFEAGVLLFLFSLSAALELYALGRTTSAIEALVKLRPDQARVVVNGSEVLRDLSEISRGDLIRVVPFEGVPVDGEIVEGESELDESAMTGESAPVPRRTGDIVLAGTQNLSGSLLVRATAEAGSAALDKVVDLVRQAQEDKSAGQRISAWFGSRYTIFVVVVFVVILVVRLGMGQDFGRAFYASLSVFVALSPCALVIAAPSASLSALAWGARKGILLKGAQVVEEAGKVTSLALDKTGTLTQGRFRLVRAWNQEGQEWEGGDWPQPLGRDLAFVASLEAHSTHPVASAILSSSPRPLPEASHIEVKPGLGLTGEVEGLCVQAGQVRLFQELPPAVQAKVAEMQQGGLTVAIAQVGERFAVFGVLDTPRDEARQVLSQLRQMGIKKILMLTGDSPATAQAVAKSVGVDEIYASLLPQNKEALVGELGQKEGGVMMVGDGVNDAPSLARAQVGVAMGGLGSDVAISAAQAILMKDSLSGLVRLRALGLKANRVVKGSLLFAATVVCLLFFGSIAADAWLPPDLHRVILPIAVMGHEGSTVLVILNGLRLLAGPGAIPQAEGAGP